MKPSYIFQFIISLLGVVGFGFPLIYMYSSVGFKAIPIILTILGFGISLALWFIIRWFYRKASKPSPVASLVTFVLGGVFISGFSFIQILPLSDEIKVMMPVIIFATFMGVCIIWFFMAWFNSQKGLAASESK